MPKTVILGIDGLPCWQWQRFADQGVMPYSAKLLPTGTLRPMQSSIPEVSSSAWASIVTGHNPGGHNVYGFTDLIDGTYGLGFTSSRTFKAKPFWQWNDGRRNLIVNVPQTYPAQPLGGHTGVRLRGLGPFAGRVSSRTVAAVRRDRLSRRRRHVHD